MNITEKDIHRFVNYKSELEPLKLQYIERNIPLFQEQIDLLKDVEENKIQNLSQIVKDKLQDKLRGQSSADIFVLNKVAENYKRKNDTLNLAADSFELKKHNIADTFIDENKNLMLKVIKSDDSSKIYLFNAENTEINDFEIIIKKPVEQIYRCKTNKEPLEIERLEDVETVEVRLK